MQSGFHCINCPLATVWRQTDITTTCEGCDNQPGRKCWSSSLSGPGKQLDWGCGIEFELGACSGKKSVGIWLSSLQRTMAERHRFESRGHEMFRVSV